MKRRIIAMAKLFGLGKLFRKIKLFLKRAKSAWYFYVDYPPFYTGQSLKNNYFIIGNPCAGFFSNFFGVLGNIDWCEKNGKIPVVYWGKKSVGMQFPMISPTSGHRCIFYYEYVNRASVLNAYWSDKGYNGSFNAWEYYFEPVSGISINQNIKATHQVHYLAPDNSGIGWDIDDGQEYLEQIAILTKLRHKDKNINLTPLAVSRGYNHMTHFRWNYIHYPTREYKMYVNKIINKYIKIKKSIQTKIDCFYQECMEGENVLGVHIRRTDHTGDSKSLDIKCFFDAIDTFPVDYKIFLATDSASTLEKLVKRYKDRLIYQKCTRSADNIAIHKPLAGPEIGEEVLIDAVLLSRTKVFIHENSNVSSAALYMNPNLEDLNIFSFMAGKQNIT